MSPRLTDHSKGSSMDSQYTTSSTEEISRDDVSGLSPTTVLARIGGPGGRGTRNVRISPEQSNPLIFYLSLIESRCQVQALKTINSGRDPDKQLPESHVEVQKLAGSLFADMATELRKSGILPMADELAGQQYSSLRQGYLSAFDNILDNMAASKHNNGTVNYFSINDGPFNSPEQLEQSKASKMSSLDPFSSAALISNPFQYQSNSTYNREWDEISLLGKGGFGEVFKVRHRVDQQYSAIKKVVITPKQMRTVDTKALLSEVRALAQYRHPNLVHYYGCWIELGGTLAAYRQRQRLLEGAENSLSLWSDDSELSNEADESNRAISTDEDLSRGITGLGIDLGKQLDEEFKKERRTTFTQEDYTKVKFSFGSSTISSSTSSNESTSDDEENGEEETDQETPKRNKAKQGRNQLSPAISFENLGSSRSSSQVSFDYEKDEEPGLSSNLSSSQISFDYEKDEEPRISTPNNDQVRILYIRLSLYPFTLEDYISTTKPSPSLDFPIRHCFHVMPTVRILKAILNGLQYLHAKKLVHRDLKPANIFFSAQNSIEPFSPAHDLINVSKACCPICGGPKDAKEVYVTPCIGDLGLAMELKDTPSPVVPSSDALVRAPHLSRLGRSGAGTTHYVPPNRSVICPKLDVYALGVIAFEMVYPFNSGSERVAVLPALKNGEFPKGFEDHEMAEGIKNMLCADRENRWSCADVREWLEGFEIRFKRNSGGNCA